MFDFLKLAAQIVLKPFALDDKESAKKFLLDLINGIKPLAASNRIKLDDALLKHLQFVLNNDALFGYVYNLILDQLRTADILFESADEDTILELCENTVPDHAEYPEAINPVLIISFVTQIVSIINAIKNK